ncbi:MAG: WD40/YVTN/BNR-like repeat-containing protein [bacterium]
MSYHPTLNNIYSVFFWPVTLVLATLSVTANAHHPHDMVDALALSTNYANDKTLYVANTGYLLKSTDGGYSWKELANGLTHNSPVSDILIIPAPGSDGDYTAFVATNGDGIYRSVDNGESWSSIKTTDSVSIVRLSAAGEQHVVAMDTEGHVHLSNDGGNVWTQSNLPGQAFASALSRKSRAGPVLAGSKSGAVYTLSESGEHWQLVGNLPADTAITTLVATPAGNSLFVGTREAGLFVSRDAGASFQPLRKQLEENYITSIVLSPEYEQDQTVYVSTREHALYVSRDAGLTWELRNRGLTTSEQANSPIYHSPHFRNLVIANNDEETFFLAGFDGLFVSGDQGEHWEELQTRPVSLIKALDISRPGRDNRYSIAIGTYGGGAYISKSGGDSWVIANRGLNTTRIGDIKFSPAYDIDDTLYSSALGYILKSDNEGESWEQIPVSYHSLRKRIVNKLIKFGLPRQTGKELLTVRDHKPVYPNAVTLSPNYSTDKDIFIGTRYHGLYRMNAAEKLPESIWDKPEMVITSIALSPDFTDDGLAFLFVRGDGLYRSDDHGANWKKVSTGVLDDSDTIDPRGLYALKYLDIAFSPAFSEDHTLLIGGPQGLYRSSNGGDDWHAVATESLGTQPNILTFKISPDFANDRTIIASVKGVGLFRSVNGGDSFEVFAQNLIEDNQSIDLLGFSGNFDQDHTLYAASDQSLFKSVDSGNNWTPIARPVRYEDRRDAIIYTGEWTSSESRDFSASTIHSSKTPGSTAKLRFSGCGIRWLALASPDGGKASVYIDDRPPTSVDLHAEKDAPLTEVYSNNDLSCGPHTIKIELPADTPGINSQGEITLDAFDVLLNNRD